MRHLTALLELLRGLVCDTATFRITAREYLLFELELAEIATFIDHFQIAHKLRLAIEQTGSRYIRLCKVLEVAI